MEGKQYFNYFTTELNNKTTANSQLYNRWHRKRNMNASSMIGKMVDFYPKSPSKYALCIKPAYKFIAQFMEITTLHGWKQIAARDRHWCEYLLWTVCILTSLVITIYVGSITWYRYLTSPTVITMERNFLEWNVTFPTGFLCSKKKINWPDVEELSKQYNVKNATKFREFVVSVAKSTYEEWKNLQEYDELEPSNYLDVIIRTAYKLRYNFSSSVRKTLESLNPVWTERGICFSYNSRITPFFNPEFVLHGNHTLEDVQDIAYFSAFDGEVFAQARDIKNDYFVSVMGPYDVPYMGSPEHSGNNETHKLLELACLPIVSDLEIRELTVQQRYCKTRSDGILTIAPVYSYNMCRVECRMNLIYELCKCIPFMYTMPGRPTCDVKGMKCIAKNSGVISILRDPVTNKRIPCPDCYPLCTDYHYRVVYETDMKPPSQSQSQQTTWVVPKYPKLRFKRRVVFNLADVCVYIGASAGFLTGASFISMVEILYFFTLRLLVYYIRARRRNKLLLGKHQHEKFNKNVNYIKKTSEFNYYGGLYQFIN